jgi:anti-sigma factor ChrR (cupin superfamily)
MSELRSDFSRLEIVHTDELPWVQSPTPQVWRKRLDLIGPPEAGRVTSVVRYDPQSRFPSHPHPGGEEILVLDGVFSDEHGEYPAGTFVLNPEGFEHAPYSLPGCTLFVKLRQSPGPRRPVRVDTRAGAFEERGVVGVRRLELYREAGFPERIHLTRVAAGVQVGPIHFPEGEELFVLEGEFSDEHGSHGPRSWLRFPPGASHTLATRSGCTLYVKQGHLSAAKTREFARSCPCSPAPNPAPSKRVCPRSVRPSAATACSRSS